MRQSCHFGGLWAGARSRERCSGPEYPLHGPPARPGGGKTFLTLSKKPCQREFLPGKEDIPLMAPSLGIYSDRGQARKGERRE